MFFNGGVAVNLMLMKTNLMLFAHKTNKSQKLLLETWANRMVRFGKPDYRVLSGPTVVRGAIGL
jgi:hypothetical protein